MAEQNQADMTRVFRALAVEKRQEIIQLLAERAFCVGALSTRLGISAGAVSQHLRILKDAGLVEPDRRGYYIHYSLTPLSDAGRSWILFSVQNLDPSKEAGNVLRKNEVRKAERAEGQGRGTLAGANQEVPR
jgi:DNA-binding transcriptional ArsR family regulator